MVLQLHCLKQIGEYKVLSSKQIRVYAFSEYKKLIIRSGLVRLTELDRLAGLKFLTDCMESLARTGYVLKLVLKILAYLS